MHVPVAATAFHFLRFFQSEEERLTALSLAESSSAKQKTLQNKLDKAVVELSVCIHSTLFDTGLIKELSVF